MFNLLSKVWRKVKEEMENNPDKYPVYPEDDGTDRPRNPYSPV